ncbi:MAG: hypothetical protein HQM08_27200 [Candidatus Riflebacteria bacterium]|nr:hypothetical protein [Candidatus Riflebacteria bacterium]
MKQLKQKFIFTLLLFFFHALSLFSANPTSISSGTIGISSLTKPLSETDNSASGTQLPTPYDEKIKVNILSQENCESSKSSINLEKDVVPHLQPSNGLQYGANALVSQLSIENTLIQGGVTLIGELIRQITYDKKLSLDKLYKTIACPNFVGSTVGSAVGSAAGAVAIPLLSRIPIAGGMLAAMAPIFGSYVGNNFGGTAVDEKANGYSLKDALHDGIKNNDWAEIACQTVGSTVGIIIGSPFPGGAVIGGIVGGLVADSIYNKFKENSSTISKAEPAKTATSTLENKPTQTASFTFDSNLGLPILDIPTQTIGIPAK